MTRAETDNLLSRREVRVANEVAVGMEYNCPAP